MQYSAVNAVAIVVASLPARRSKSVVFSWNTKLSFCFSSRSDICAERTVFTYIRRFGRMRLRCLQTASQPLLLLHSSSQALPGH